MTTTSENSINDRCKHLFPSVKYLMKREFGNDHNTNPEMYELGLLIWNTCKVAVIKWETSAI